MDEAQDGDLAARRRDLEREFEDKARDLKAQHKRRMDALDADRADWEAKRRVQQRELADRIEKVKRAEDNHKRDAEALRAARVELETTKAELTRQRVLRAEVREAEAVKSGADDRLRAARGLLALASFVALAATAGTAAFLAVGSTRVALGLCVVGLAAAVGVELRRRLTRRD